MKYKITDLAELIGCTTSAIRYFEKENLINVEKDDNGHRLYDIADVFRLLSYEKYRSMEIPMRTIVKQFSGTENDRHLIEKREEDCKEAALAKARYYTNLAGAIDAHLYSIRNIDTLLDHYELAKSPEQFVIYDNECGWISKNRHSQQLLRRWIDAMPQVRLVVLHQATNSGVFGYGILPSLKEDLQLPGGLHFKKLPSCSCLHTVITIDPSYLLNPHKIFEQAFTYAKKKHLAIKSGAWGNFLLTEVGQNNDLKIFLELWIPVSI